MRNAFVDYLNSLHNASASNDNALAESQAVNSFYQDIVVRRDIAAFIGEKLSKNSGCVVLSGHAGDGKTSIILQILRDYGLIGDNDLLKPFDEITSEAFGRELLYIKDMSELSEGEQVQKLRQALVNPLTGKSSIVVANTGPLIRSFKELSMDNGVSTDEVEWHVLEALDGASVEPVSIAGYDVLIINMARIDNVWLAPSLLDNIVNSKHWSDCDGCASAATCPIIKNVRDVQANVEYIKRFVTYFFRWLFESDRRMTVRQILAQISFSITGNLSCHTLPTEKNSLFNYHFANLFFGHKGAAIIPEAMQIRGVTELQGLELDLRELPNEYRVFVRNDFADVHESVREVTKRAWDIAVSRYAIGERENDAQFQSTRRAIRRFLMFYGRYDETQFNALLSVLYSPVYPEYLRLRESRLHSFEMKPLKQTIINALYSLFVGQDPSGEISKVYLPLRRSGNDSQSVKLLRGQIDIQEIDLEQLERGGSVEKQNCHYELHLCFSSMPVSYPVSLLLLDYFYKLANGGISTKLKPALSHGLDRMTSELYCAYQLKQQDGIVQLLVNHKHGVRVVKLEIFDNKIYLG